MNTHKKLIDQIAACLGKRQVVHYNGDTVVVTIDTLGTGPVFVSFTVTPPKTVVVVATTLWAVPPDKREGLARYLAARNAPDPVGYEIDTVDGSAICRLSDHIDKGKSLCRQIDDLLINVMVAMDQMRHSCVEPSPF